MMVRIGSLSPGDVVQTLATGKVGTILPPRTDHGSRFLGVDVAFDDRDRSLHPDVVVKLVKRASLLR